MNTLIISDRFKLLCPDGFRVLSKEEQAAINRLGDGESICLSNEDCHMLISIGWKAVGAFSSLFLSATALEKGMESRIRKAMQPYGYLKESVLTRQIAGRKAAGFRYTYTAQNTDMIGESYVFQSGRSIVYFHLYARAALRDPILSEWNELLGAVVSD